MTMSLTSSTVLARVEECEQLPILLVIFPSFETSMCGSEVVLLKHMRLLLVEFCRNDEVLRNDRIFV
jgi:hypothetical protein